jgi:YegS/Rv2252/BmrU family lipid kinase
MQPLVLLANPTSGLSAVAAAGAGKAARRRTLEAAAQDLSRRFAVELCIENTSRAIEKRACQAIRDGVQTVVAAGGDGTVNAVVNGLMQAQMPLDDVRLGVLPMGTANVLAYNLHIPREWRAACKIIRKGHTRKIDVGLAVAQSHDRSKIKSAPAKSTRASSLVSRYFLLMAGIGYDAKVIEDTSLRLKYVLRDFAYVLKTLENVVRHQGTQITLQLDGKTTYANIAWLVMVGNAAAYAWKIKVTPHARLDDGLLDVCLMPFENKIISVQQALQVLTGQHIERGIAQYWQVESLRVESSPNVPIQLDGDEWADTPVELSILPGAISILAPPENDAPAPLLPGS